MNAPNEFLCRGILRHRNKQLNCFVSIRQEIFNIPNDFIIEFATLYLGDSKSLEILCEEFAILVQRSSCEWLTVLYCIDASFERWSGSKRRVFAFA